MFKFLFGVFLFIFVILVVVQLAYELAVYAVPLALAGLVVWGVVRLVRSKNRSRS